MARPPRLVTKTASSVADRPRKGTRHQREASPNDSPIEIDSEENEFTESRVIQDDMGYDGEEQLLDDADARETGEIGVATYEPDQWEAEQDDSGDEVDEATSRSEGGQSTNDQLVRVHHMKGCSS